VADVRRPEGCMCSMKQGDDTHAERMEMTTIRVRIDGMACGHCVEAVRRELVSLPGVRVDSVSIGEAQVSFDEGAASRQDIEGAIRKAGYTPVPA
jgi:copper chaperone